MSGKKTALVIRSSTLNSLWSLEEVLQQRGVEHHYINAFMEDVSAYDPLSYDLVIVLGGAVGVPNVREYPYLGDVISFLQTRMERDLPTFGICLGSQLIAAALGAEVYAGEQGFELGWLPLTISDAGQDTSLRHLSSSKTQMFFSHGDTFDLPKGATLLASSDMYKNQAYSYGKNVLATQFHPEVERGFVYELLINHVGKLTGENPVADIGVVRKNTERYIDTLGIQTGLFFGEWLDQALNL